MASSGVDARELQALARRLAAAARNPQQEFRRVVASAKRVAKTEVARAAALVYNASTRRIAQGLTTDQSSELAFVVTGTRRTLTAASFGGRQTKRGYRYQRLRGGRVNTEPLGFVPRGRAVPFRRLGRERLPIEVIYGPSVADMMNNPRVVAPASSVIVGRMKQDLERRIAAALGAV